MARTPANHTVGIRAVGNKVFLGIGLAVSLALAFFISPLASSSPDGLEKVAADKNLDTQVGDHTLANGPLADYSVKGLDNSRLATGLSGIIGTTATLAIGWGLFAAVKRVRDRSDNGRNDVESAVTAGAGPV